MSVVADRHEAIPASAGSGHLPVHVAIIMDGNRRWAQIHGLPGGEGHRRGVEAVRQTVAAATEIGIRYLTLYSFSLENWTRPEDEVSFLFGLFRRYIRRDVAELDAAGCRISVIGNRAGMPADIRALIEEAESRTDHNNTLDVIFAFNYAGRDEIARAARRIAEEVRDGHLDPANVDVEEVARHLDTARFPDPDLVIRTSGEQRLSNFLLWQSAYAEFVFSPVLWPDFGRDALRAAVTEYQSRSRRFGGRVAT